MLDLFLTAFCIITLIVVFLNPCGAGSKRESGITRDRYWSAPAAEIVPFPVHAGEEVLDTLLLVVRNGVQFWRLGTILNRSGHSLFRPPKPIDLSQARAGAIDLDLDDEEAYAEGHMRGARGGHGYSQVSTGATEGSTTFFDAGTELEGQQLTRQGVFGTGKGQVGYSAGRDDLNERDEEQWDRMG